MAYPGSFEQAKRRAESLGRWLLVNVQSASEFQSHQLNRDTWKHEAVKNVVKENFVFWQTFDHSEELRSQQGDDDPATQARKRGVPKASAKTAAKRKAAAPKQAATLTLPK